MPTRNISRRLTFRSPFTLKPIEGILPAGAYEVEVDEQEMAGLERSAFVRVATLFIVSAGGTSRTYTVKASDLNAALVGDGQSPLSDSQRDPALTARANSLEEDESAKHRSEMHAEWREEEDGASSVSPQ